jgi:SOS-response transcriptional repressor LexA
MLTKKQKELLLLIRDCVAIEGVPPSVDEMNTALGL